jgi:hypothetical protein
MTCAAAGSDAEAMSSAENALDQTVRDMTLLSGFDVFSLFLIIKFPVKLLRTRFDEPRQSPEAFDRPFGDYNDDD